MCYSKICHDFCSTKCSNSDKNTLLQKKNTCIEKYGGLGYASSLLNKTARNTCLKKYNVEYSAQSKEIYEKLKESNYKKYGVKFTSQLKENRKKFKETCLKNTALIMYQKFLQ